MTHDPRKMFALLAETAIHESDDPNTKNAAMIVRSDGYAVRAANQFVTRHVGKPTPEGWVDRVRDNSPEGKKFKYAVMSHAEAGAVLQAVRKIAARDRDDMFALWAACPACARLVVESGVKHLHTLSENALGGCPERWAEEVKLGRVVLEAGGVKVTEYDFDGSLGYGLLFDGRMIYL